MKIREGKYYRTRGGAVVGPMLKKIAPSKYPWFAGDQEFSFLEWRPNGRYLYYKPDFMDLISEVYVSDTPPADGASKFTDCAIGTYAPAPETKTLRNEFAMAALIGLLAAGGDLADCGRDEIAAEAWRQADAMMKARKK